MSIQHNNAMYHGREAIYVRNVENGNIDLDGIRRSEVRAEVKRRLTDIGLPYWLDRVQQGSASLDPKDKKKGIDMVPLWYHSEIDELQDEQ